MSRRSLRGNIAGQTRRRIIVDDGRFNHGYKVTSFQCWPENNNTGVEGVLSLSEEGATRGDAGENAQIAWVVAGDNQVPSITGVVEVVDPNHVVVRDLFVYNNASTSMNYLVVIEPITLDADQAVIALIKEVSQDV